MFRTFNLDSTWQLLTAGLNNEEPRLGNFDLNRYCSILSNSTTTTYSNAYYGAYPQHDSEWQAIGLTTRACRSRGTFPPPCIKLGGDSRISLNSKARHDPRLVGVSASSVQVKESKYCGCYGPEPQDTVYESISWSNFELVQFRGQPISS